jgi:nucleotide-binding universal stress UspA family protein
MVLPEVRDEMQAEAREIAAEAAAELKANVVVIGGGGREGPRDYLVGSTVERIVRHSPVPVLVIK